MSGNTSTRRAILRLERVVKTYTMGAVEVFALRGVDLDLLDGELLVLLGPSGSGKSTLLNILGGLDTPTSGRVWFCEQDLGQADGERLTEFRRRHVGFVFAMPRKQTSTILDSDVAFQGRHCDVADKA